MKSESDADGPGEAGRGDITKCTEEFTLKFWLWGISKVCLQNKYLLREKFTGETDSTLNSHSLSPSLTHTCVQSRFSWVQLCDHTDCSPPSSSAHGILQARILEWVAMPFSRGSSQPRNRTHVFYVSCIGRCHLTYYQFMCNLISVSNYGLLSHIILN